MLHDARDEDVVAVADGVDLDLAAHHVLVDQNRVLDLVAGDDLHELADIGLLVGNLHALTAQNVGRTDENRVAQLVGGLDGLLLGHNRVARRTRDAALLEDNVELFAVLSGVDRPCRGAENRNAELFEVRREVDGGLTAELNDRVVRLLGLDNAGHVLRSQRLEVQTVSGIEVGGDGLRVVVDDDGLIALFLECPGTMYGAEVKLDTLSDTDRAGTKDEDFLSVVCLVQLRFRRRIRNSNTVWLLRTQRHRYLPSCKLR